LLLFAACGAAQTVEGSIVDSVTGAGSPAVQVFLQAVATAVRPGDYYAPAFAEPGGAPQLDEMLFSQADRVTGE